MKNQTYRMTMLYDFYGELLTDRQKEFFDLYYNEDLSLGEIAENNGISRQGVRDSLSRAARKLNEYEQKLGLLKAYHQRRERDETVRGLIAKIKNTEGSGNILPLLDQIEELMTRNSD